MMPVTVDKRLMARLVVAAMFAATAVPQLVAAQDSGERLSLAERVSRLEQQQSQGGIGLVNQVQQLRSQVQQLQGQIEELQHQLQQFQQTSKDQYVDLDSRLGRLEGRPPTASSTAAPVDNGPMELGDVQLGGQAQTTTGDSTAGPPTQEGSGVNGNGATAGDAQADYQHAFTALRNGDFAAASRLFNAFISKYPNNDLTPNAYYWLGESYYGTQNYQVAEQTFQNLLRRFPNDAKAPGALLKVGYCQYELKQWDKARATLNQVRQQYPDSQEARLAEGRLRALGTQAGN